MSLLPSSGPHVDARQEGDLQLIGVDSEETESVLDALASETARSLLTAIYEEPASASELATRLDMSIQRVSYHLERLADAGIVHVGGTRYSEKGNEMNVYAPADDPIVVFVGTPERRTRFRDLLTRLVGAVGVLILASAIVQLYVEFTIRGGGDGGGGTLPPPTFAPPGVTFFLGGGLVLVLVYGWWIRRRWHRRTAQNRF